MGTRQSLPRCFRGAAHFLNSTFTPVSVSTILNGCTGNAVPNGNLQQASTEQRVTNPRLSYGDHAT